MQRYAKKVCRKRKRYVRYAKVCKKKNVKKVIYVVRYAAKVCKGMQRYSKTKKDKQKKVVYAEKQVCNKRCM
jgi:hypothetical protein